MAHFFKTNLGKWQIQVSLGKDPKTGKYKRKSKNFKTKKEANNWLAQITNEKNMGINFDSKGLS